MNRYDLQTLAELRVAEARDLLNNGYYGGAYYLLGYGIECALKACIARQTRKYGFPDLRRARDSHTHDLEQLITVVGLRQEKDHIARSDKEFDSNWRTISQWSEQVRYSTNVSREEAENFFSAIIEPRHGVLSWLKNWW